MSFIFGWIQNWYDYFIGCYNHLLYSKTDMNPNQEIIIKPYMRQPKSAIRFRSEDYNNAKSVLIRGMKAKYPSSLIEVSSALIEVSFPTESELRAALQDFPSVRLGFFVQEECVSVASIRIHDESVIDQLLQQDWFLAVDDSCVSFGNPIHINNQSDKLF